MPELYALAGCPVDHSPSPAMHNAAFAALGLDARYEVRTTARGEGARVVTAVRDGTLAGANVTTPLKTEIAALVERRGAAAQARAVNTLWREDGAVVGDLTDVDGVHAPLVALGVTRGCEGLVIGAGGASRAALLAFARLGLWPHVAARRPAEARRLLDELGMSAAAVLDVTDRRGLARLFPRLGIVVQATTAGRRGERLDLPWDRLAPSSIAFEMLYRPRRTPFLADAAAAGARVVEGWQMLLAQGARSFELWTRQPAPRAVMHAALAAALTL